MMKNILLFTAFIFILNSAHSQNIDKNLENKVMQKVFDELTKQNFVKFNRVTIEGKLASCELEFQYAYKDNRAKNGALINTNGSFAAMYSGQKTPGYSLKINAYQLDLASEKKWNVIEPAYTNIKFKNIDFSKYKTIDFTCESGGKCTGYSDNNLKLNFDLASLKEFEPEIFFSLSKGGYDNLLKLSTLMPTQKVKTEFNGFRDCNTEILIMVGDDLKKLITK
jgi:hypothetical protein